MYKLLSAWFFKVSYVCIGYEIVSEAYNGDRFKKFITEKLFPYFEEHKLSILIMDNCRFDHKQDILGLLNPNIISYKFIHHYSPQLNPIEEFFSSVKAGYKCIKPRPSSPAEVRTYVIDVMKDRSKPLDALFERMQKFILIVLLGQPFIE